MTVKPPGQIFKSLHERTACLLRQVSKEREQFYHGLERLLVLLVARSCLASYENATQKILKC